MLYIQKNYFTSTDDHKVSRRRVIECVAIPLEKQHCLFQKNKIYIPDATKSNLVLGSVVEIDQASKRRDVGHRRIEHAVVLKHNLAGDDCDELSGDRHRNAHRRRRTVVQQRRQLQRHIRPSVSVDVVAIDAEVRIAAVQERVSDRAWCRQPAVVRAASDQYERGNRCDARRNRAMIHLRRLPRVRDSVENVDDVRCVLRVVVVGPTARPHRLVLEVADGGAAERATFLRQTLCFRHDDLFAHTESDNVSVRITTENKQQGKYNFITGVPSMPIILSTSL